VLASKQLNPNLDVMARAVHVDAVNRLHQAGTNHLLSESILGFQLLQVAMVQMGLLPKLCPYVVREVIWNREPIDIRTLTGIDKGLFKIICVVKDDKVMELALDYVLLKGDRIVVMGAQDNIRRFIESG
jgi:Trk K+ transport system NAD-binding subunit